MELEVLCSEFCFLCLAKLHPADLANDAGTSFTPKRGRKRKNSEVFCSKTNVNALSVACRRKRYETLMKYFLHYCGKSNQEHQEQLMRRLLPALLIEMEEQQSNTEQEGGDSGGRPIPSDQKMFPVCVKCEDKVSELMQLHMELEVIQLKLVDKLKKIKDLVVNCSVYGRDEDAKGQMRDLEMILKQHEKGNPMESASGDNSSIVRRKRAWLDAVLELQTTAFEKFEEMNDIPCVILKRCMPVPVNRIMVMESDAVIYTDAVHQNDEAVEQIEVKEGNLSIDPAFPLEFGNEDDNPDPASESHVEEDNDVKSLLRPKRAIRRPNFYSDNIQWEKSAKQLSIHVPPPLSKTDPDEILSLPTVPVEKRRKRGKKGTRKVKQRRRLRGDQLPPKSRHSFKKHPLHCHAKFKDNKTSRFLECTTCNYTCVPMASFIQHLRTHETSEKLYECTEEDCEDKLFSGKQFYDFHVIQHTDPHYFWLCKPCQKFIPPPIFKKHMERHNLNQMFPCKHCYYCCETVAEVVSHEIYHGKTTKMCLFCPETFSTMLPWTKHMYEKHRCQDLLLECDFKNCSEKCFTEAQLRQHKIKHESTFQCTYCDREYTCNNGLRKHIRIIHEKEKIHKCKIEGCTKSFHLKSERDKHGVLEHGLPKIKCDMCDFEYCSEEAVRKHKRKKHAAENPIGCSTCGKVFLTQAALKRHEKIHGPRCHVCEQCGYAATNRRRFKAHMETHGERRFACDYCEKRFVTKIALKDHIYTHTGERPYVCHYCPAAFNQRGALNTHVKRHEGKEKLVSRPKISF